MDKIELEEINLIGLSLPTKTTNEMGKSYFIGCKVEPGATIPEGLASLLISKGLYQKIVAAGKMPDCVANTWKEIWNSSIPRAYQTDFEVYDEKSKDWNKAKVDVFVSIQH
jgi:predicted transcriptional regulator YdeE